MNHKSPPGSANRPSIAGSAELVHAEIDDYAVSIGRFRAGRIPEAVFLENRLRHGVYGQRQDGVHMMRSKLPLGLLAPEQLEAFADLTETYSAGIAHLTTRQDIQVHFIPLEKSVDVMRVLADARMTSREACGNVVRNVTASPLAGVERGEPFDVTAYGMAIARFLLRIPDGQSLGRKFKLTLHGTDDPRFNLSAIHDVGLTARVRDGVQGFHMVVGGGLGPVAQEAQLFSEFVPAAEVFPILRAMLRVFGQHGEKKNRARARMKFLVQSFGIDRFRDEVLAVRATFEDDPAWRAYEDELDAWDDLVLHQPGPDALPGARDAEEARWLRTNVLLQKQAGYASINVRVPSGDLTPHQLRAIAALLREHSGDTLRIGADQSLWIRFVPTDRVLALRDGLRPLGLHGANAGGLGDTVTCPGADTCKLGITTPRSLARQIQDELDDIAQDPRLERLRVHVSGCPNSCAQHHIGDIGFFGGAKTVQGVTSPQFMLLLGGRPGGARFEEEGDGFGFTVVKLPAARCGEAVRRIATLYLDERTSEEEPFDRFVRRQGRARFKELLADLVPIPGPDEAPELYREYGKQEQAFKVVRGTGECAGSVVLQGDLLLIEADRFSDRAVDLLESKGEAGVVRDAALQAFRFGARAMLSTQGIGEVKDDAVLSTFKDAIYAKGIIYEGFGHYLIHALTEDAAAVQGDRLRRLVTEAGLFVEEAHSIVGKLLNPAEAR